MTEQQKELIEELRGMSCQRSAINQERLGEIAKELEQMWTAEETKNEQH